MRHSLDATILGAELARRQPPAKVDARELIEAACKDLRGIFEKHPKQKRLYRSKHKRRATRKTRRAGATVGGIRELLARSLEIPNHRATVVHTTRIEARSRAWKNDTQSGFIDVLSQFGEPVDNGSGVDAYLLGGIKVEVRDAETALEFANGSHIELIGMDNLRATNKKRGNAKHVFWIDEAQDFRFLNEFYKATVIGSLNDYKGECWMSGTPGRDCSGLFYEATREDEERDDTWEVHEVAVTDNPYFGCAVWEDGQWFVEWRDLEAKDEDSPPEWTTKRSGPYATEEEADAVAITTRWENTAGAHIRDNKLREDDPDVLREWYAKWVKGDLAYVYPVHIVPKHKLVYAPQRLADNPFIGTHPRFESHPKWVDWEAAMRDLPRKGRGEYQWLFGIGADFGFYPDPFAFVCAAFNREMADVFEMFSWKHTRVLTDDQGDYLKLLYDTMPNCISFVGDPAGKQDDFEVWRTKLNLPIEEANKQGKAALEEFLANAIRREQFHYREGSPLLTEHKNLMYLPQKPGKPREVDKHRRSADGKVYGDHCSDGMRYLYADIDHHLYRDPPKDERTQVEREEAAIEEAVDRNERIREAMRVRGEYEEWGYE